MFLYIMNMVVLGLAGYFCGKLFDLVKKLSDEYTAPIACTLEDPDSTTPLASPSIFEAPTKALSCIIPAYNEQDRLSTTLDEALNYLQRRRDKQGPQFTYELVVVDDGSKDGTANVARNYIRQYGLDTVRLLRVSANRGKGHAVKRGMAAARGEFCLMMDADGATRFADLEKLEGEMEKIMQPSFGASKAAAAASGDSQGELGVVFGSRAHLAQDAVAKRSPLRNFLTRGFHALVYFVAGGRIRDTQCGFKLFTRRAAAVLFSNVRLQRWCFDVELLYLAEQLGIPVAEVSVNWTEIPGSKIRFTSILLMATELLIIKMCYPVLGIWSIHSELTMAKKTS
ncbi:hypothetical protein CHLRE_16g652850v5 [Chlamydomonas reinhardtii]|uniref:dolichyl-phosphate beta-glucosyltransferase n=1 Tax=Chlamydomonas reinhardtii TaxID=3055 RepID=A0A2K3CSY8_CHLRE|nr:uncharacterized protein CHLRE_16g652850v5 [Chlamydomonas reinhardtii]PNW71403.1 hypothetical protein CHLRE_16g652850v5 [Chlamydomonas reinhardtii]